MVFRMLLETPALDHPWMERLFPQHVVQMPRSSVLTFFRMGSSLILLLPLPLPFSHPQAATVSCHPHLCWMLLLPGTAMTAWYRPTSASFSSSAATSSSWPGQAVGVYISTSSMFALTSQLLALFLCSVTELGAPSGLFSFSAAWEVPSK